MEQIRVTASQVLADLRAGLTRTNKDKFYNPELGCIKEKYNLTTSQLKQIFASPSLKGKKTKLAAEAAAERMRNRAGKVSNFVFEDDLTPADVEVEAEA